MRDGETVVYCTDGETVTVNLLQPAQILALEAAVFQPEMAGFRAEYTEATRREFIPQGEALVAAVTRLQPETQVQQVELDAMPTVNDRSESELARMEAFAMTLLQSGQTLHVPTPEGPTVISLKQMGPLTLVGAQFAGGGEVYEREPFRAFQNAGLFEAMGNGTLQTADGQAVGLFESSQPTNAPIAQVAAAVEANAINQPSSQVVETAPITAAPQAGQREAVAPQAPTLVAPGAESPGTTPGKPQPPRPTLRTQQTQPQGTPMTTTLEKPAVQAEVQPVLLSDMMSRRSQDVLRGICGLDGRGAQAEPRKPGEAFKALATDAYGVENFLKGNGVEFKGSADYVINKAALELGLSPEFKDQVLADVKREECVPRVVLATQKEQGDLATDNVWKKVSQLSPSAYEAAAPAEVKGRLVEQSSSLETSRSKVMESLGITLKSQEAAQTQEAPKRAYAPRYEVAPAGEKTDRAIAFRDTLTVSQLREFQNALEVMGAKQDAKNYARDFTEKFARSGYRMNDGGVSAGMVERLDKLQTQMEAVVPAYRESVKASFEQVLGDKGRVDMPKAGVLVEGKGDTLTVKDRETKQLQLLVKEGEVLINRVPPVVVGKVEVIADLSRQQQQQQVAAKPQPVKAGGGRD